MPHFQLPKLGTDTQRDNSLYEVAGDEASAAANLKLEMDLWTFGGCEVSSGGFVCNMQNEVFIINCMRRIILSMSQSSVLVAPTDNSYLPSSVHVELEFQLPLIHDPSKTNLQTSQGIEALI